MTKESKKDVYLDEASVSLRLYPRYGRTYKGQRAYLTTPYPRGDSFTLYGAMSSAGLESLAYHKGPGNSDSFYTFLSTYLVPRLTNKHRVILDNVGFHKTNKITALLDKTGCEVLFLPPYCPELNLIEHMWSKINTFLRYYSARTPATLKQGLTDSLSKLNKTDFIGWSRQAHKSGQLLRKQL